MIWNMEAENAIFDLIRNQLDSFSAKKCLHDIGLGACDELYAPASAAHLVLVYSKSEHPFTADEIDWLKTADTVLSFAIEQNTNIYFVELSCEVEDYYIIAAAIVKIFNVAFPDKNIFVFKIGDNIAFGIAREIEEKIHNNFAVTGLINIDNIDCYEELLYELPTADVYDFPYLIISNSPQEQTDNRKYEKNIYNPDYLSFLNEFESFYGVDTSRERNRFWNEIQDALEENEDFNIAITYKEACDELKNIAESEDVSSYEDLDAAQLAEEKAERFVISHSNEEENEMSDNSELQFSKEAYGNAEQMLKEMLKKDK